MFQEGGREPTEVGLVPDSCAVLVRRKKKAGRTMHIPGASLDTARRVARFLQGAGLGDAGLPELRGLWDAARAIGCEDLAHACVARAWEIRAEWMPAAEPAGALEEEGAWMYTVI